MITVWIRRIIFESIPSIWIDIGSDFTNLDLVDINLSGSGIWNKVMAISSREVLLDLLFLLDGCLIFNWSEVESKVSQEKDEALNTC